MNRQSPVIPCVLNIFSTGWQENCHRNFVASSGRWNWSPMPWTPMRCRDWKIYYVTLGTIDLCLIKNVIQWCFTMLYIYYDIYDIYINEWSALYYTLICVLPFIPWRRRWAKRSIPNCWRSTALASDWPSTLKASLVGPLAGLMPIFFKFL